MAYMIYQQFKTAVKDAYAGRDVDKLTQEAETFIEWIEALEINPQVRNTLLEQMKAIAEAFQELSVHQVLHSDANRGSS